MIIAGSLGQFGKSLATFLIERARKKKTRVSSEKSERDVWTPAERVLRALISEKTEAEIKAEKKARKAMVKLRKKEIQFSECSVSPIRYEIYSRA